MNRFHSLLTRTALLLAPLCPILSSPASATTVSLSVEAPGVQQSSFSNIVTEDFDSLSTGSTTLINSAVGTYSAAAPGGMIVSADAYGGAYQTQYLAVGNQSLPTTSITLDLAGPATYFGFYFGAIDALNTVDIFDGAELVASITRATILPLLGGDPDYFGNPNTGENTGEPYVYVNVVATSGTFDRVLFSNPSGTGLESDNHSVQVVPEPSSLAIAGIGLLGVGGATLRRRRRRKAG
ncbi:PEP-CTERM sorting domain-containing protein [Tautonia plasticadhaerens]|uniref:PEP-CTERM motif protein n=1 Tax=Tautonia plasticadhaerens TaxID=2527974 RepID=A0A518HE01_9BACT|nr:PEP-CTERM sorting domain-containing protein [Tautonia plasticadhaerens]QDV39070.1 PEP-CTERM motif protein [Tautonia plasticadhaerens]